MNDLEIELKQLSLEEKEIEKRTLEIAKRKREIDIELSLENEGDIFEDKWFYFTNSLIGEYLFYSKKSPNKVSAYENRKHIEGKSGFKYKTVKFEGYAFYYNTDKRRSEVENSMVLGAEAWCDTNWENNVIKIGMNSSWNIHFVPKEEALDWYSKKLEQVLNFDGGVVCGYDDSIKTRYSIRVGIDVESKIN